MRIPSRILVRTSTQSFLPSSHLLTAEEKRYERRRPVTIGLVWLLPSFLPPGGKHSRRRSQHTHAEHSDNTPTSFTHSSCRYPFMICQPLDHVCIHSEHGQLSRRQARATESVIVHAHFSWISVRGDGSLHIARCCRRKDLRHPARTTYNA